MTHPANSEWQTAYRLSLTINSRLRKSLQVSINTVKEAYRQLEDQGLISVRPQSGYYVCHAPSNLLELEERYVSEEKVSLSGISVFLAQIVKSRWILTMSI